MRYKDLLKDQSNDVRLKTHQLMRDNMVKDPVTRRVLDDTVEDANAVLQGMRLRISGAICAVVIMAYEEALDREDKRAKQRKKAAKKSKKKGSKK